jgi:hypothetical protein
MDREQMPCLHLLLFLCKRCGEALAICVASERRTVEKIDGDSHHVRCFCGWADNLLGVEALRHCVLDSVGTENRPQSIPREVPNERLSNPS